VRAASYHTTKVIAHRKPENIANCVLKLVVTTTSISTGGLPSRPNTSIRVHSPNGISIGSAVFAEMTAECPYALQ